MICYSYEIVYFSNNNIIIDKNKQYVIYKQNMIYFLFISIFRTIYQKHKNKNIKEKYFSFHFSYIYFIFLYKIKLNYY